MRTSNYQFDQDDLDSVAISLSSKGVDKPMQMMQAAFGYLTTWGMNYPIVDIYLRSKADGEFMAVFRHRPYQDGDSPGYVIGAVFDSHTKKYGFHS